MSSLPIGFDRIGWKLSVRVGMESCSAACLPIGFDRIGWKLNWFLKAVICSSLIAYRLASIGLVGN